ncbi:MAG TPA: triose-phosphate isomerase [Chloroflexota bacterium]|nr:triose-phosphate isomerase [Chloroflexota bacterium]
MAEPERLPLLAANWKMNLTVADGVALVEGLRPRLESTPGVEIVICPPFVSILAISSALASSPILVGAQDVYWADRGAYTGEVSPPMLAPFCRYVIVGHSERRQFFGVTDDIVNRQIRAMLPHRLRPIMCVGETLSENEAGHTADVVDRQLRRGLAHIATCPGLVIAYEPIWAIGTGRAATGSDANAVIGTIRSILGDVMGPDIARSTRILYGGSVTADNIKEFVTQDEIDGGLVGGASLKADDFVAIARVSAAAKQSSTT